MFGLPVYLIISDGLPVFSERSSCTIAGHLGILRCVKSQTSADLRGKFFANDELEALFYIFIYYTSLHVSSITVLIIRRSNCINASSGMIKF
jgi:hypothetical protein